MTACRFTADRRAFLRGMREAERKTKQVARALMRVKAKTRTQKGGKTYQPGDHFEIDDTAGEAMLRAGIALEADPEPEEAPKGKPKPKPEK